MSYWYLARVELHEKTVNGKVVKPSEKDYDNLHKAMRKPAFSRIVDVEGGERKRLPDATYEKQEGKGDTMASVSAAIREAADSAWTPNSYVLVRYTTEDFKQRNLLPAPQSLIDFENQNPAGK